MENSGGLEGDMMGVDDETSRVTLLGAKRPLQMALSGRPSDMTAQRLPLLGELVLEQVFGLHVTM